jgi:hypothetical protein
MWVRIDDASPLHPKFVRAGAEAFALWVAGLCYCNRYRTGGVIPMNAVPNLLTGLTVRRAAELAAALATNDPERPSWVEEPGGYRVHDYGEYQPRQEAVEAARRAQATLRQRRLRERRRRDLGEDAARGEAAAQPVTRDGVRYVTRDVTPDETPVTRDGTREVTGPITRDVTRDGHARVTAYSLPLPEPLPLSRPVLEREEFSFVPAREGRDLDGEFAVWGSRYPRQQGLAPGREVYLAKGAGGELPPIEDLLAALAAQMTAQPDPRFWRLPARYLRERGWNDQVLGTAAGEEIRRREGRRRSRGSDPGRQARLRAIVEDALADGGEPAVDGQPASGARGATEERDGGL